MNMMSRGNSHALAAAPAMMRATPSSAAAAPEQRASSCARDRGGPESDRREGGYFAQRTCDADDDCRVEAEQYSVEARDDDDSDVRHTVRGLPLDAAFVRFGRLPDMLETGCRNVSALSFPRITRFGLAAGLSRHRRCRYNAFFGLRTGDFHWTRAATISIYAVIRSPGRRRKCVPPWPRRKGATMSTAITPPSIA